MQKMLGNKKAYWIFVIPALVIYLVMAFIPIAMSGYYSTMQWDGIGEKIFIGIDNYLELVKDEAFLLSARNSLILAVASIVGQLIPALFFALVLARNIKGERAYRTIYFIPVLLSTVVIGQLFLKIYNPDYGALNAVLTKLGLEGKDWLGDKRYVLASSFFPIVWQYIGYHMLILYTGIKSVPSDIYEAAQIDGAGEWQTYRRICLPLCKGAICSAAILVFIDYWNMVEQPLILLTDAETHPLSVFLSKINEGEIGLAFAVATIYMVPSLLIFLYGEEYLVDGITYQGGIKG